MPPSILGNHTSLKGNWWKKHYASFSSKYHDYIVEAATAVVAISLMVMYSPMVVASFGAVVKSIPQFLLKIAPLPVTSFTCGSGLN